MQVSDTTAPPLGKRVEMAGDRGQAPFRLVAPVVASALALGTGGGFALAAVLTLTRLLGIPEGAWWLAIAQAHGHLQLYGWAGLFVLGVALHFFPRLRGAPLVGRRAVAPLLACQVAALLLRGVSQPLAAASGAGLWRTALVMSGALELVALMGFVALAGSTMGRGPALATRRAFVAVAPFIAVAFLALTLAAAVNLADVARAAASPVAVVPGPQDAANTTLGLFGFLVPVAVAMSAQALPMYAGLSAFPRRTLWPLAGCYGLGLAASIGSLTAVAGWWPGVAGGVGDLLLGGALLAFFGVCVGMMRQRGKLPGSVAVLAPQPQRLASGYRRRMEMERTAYGPFVALIGSAYGWAILGATMLVVDGVARLAGAPAAPMAPDAIRHAFAVGFIALLIAGIAVRMLPAFSGGAIASPRLVSATLWLGNAAALLRVGAIIAESLLGASVATHVAFGLSGPVGLIFAVCLIVNLWPAVVTSASAPLR